MSNVIVLIPTDGVLKLSNKFINNLKFIRKEIKSMEEVKPLTVGKLKEIMKDIPDDSPVELSSDTGLDNGKVVVEDAYYKRNKYDSLVIYANQTEDY